MDALTPADIAAILAKLGLDSATTDMAALLAKLDELIARQAAAAEMDAQAQTAQATIAELLGQLAAANTTICGCRSHLARLLETNPPDYSSPLAFVTSTVDLHNAVNTRLKARFVPLFQSLAALRPAGPLKREPYQPAVIPDQRPRGLLPRGET